MICVRTTVIADTALQCFTKARDFPRCTCLVHWRFPLGMLQLRGEAVADKASSPPYCWRILSGDYCGLCGGVRTQNKHTIARAALREVLHVSEEAQMEEARKGERLLTGGAWGPWVLR